MLCKETDENKDDGKAGDLREKWSRREGEEVLRLMPPQGDSQKGRTDMRAVAAESEAAVCVPAVADERSTEKYERSNN